MKDITRLMIELYCLEQLGYDFMGYEKAGNGVYTFHHLIVPKCKNGPETVQNGAIIRRIPHDYLHIIEHTDYDVFSAITSEMVDMNLKGHLDIHNIEHINDLLNYFEREYSNYTTKHGKPLIKEQYTRRLLRK